MKRFNQLAGEARQVVAAGFDQLVAYVGVSVCRPNQLFMGHGLSFGGIPFRVGA